MEQRTKWQCRQIILISCVLSTLCVLLSTVEANSGTGNKPISVFHRHYDCLVTFYHNGHVVNSSLGEKDQHVDNITAQFIAFGRQFVVDLHLNKQLFSGSYVEKVFHSHGQSSERYHISRKKENCHYHGRLRFQPKSEAALSICDGLRGYITDRQDTYHIEPVGGRIHRVYRNRDQRKLPFKCGTEGHDSRLRYHKEIIHRHKRSIKAPYDSNSNTRYVELYLVNDYRTFERHGKQQDVVIRRSQEIANIVSSLYRQLNIYVALVGVEVWAGGDLVSVSTSADSTMENFLRYRKERINPFHHNDNAQLITGVFFDHGVVGKAIKGPICTHQFSGGVNMDYGGAVSLVATTVAHEMGHNFGMEHDNDTMCECGEEKCIMAATSGKISPRKWSSCSQNALAEAFDLGMEYCLRNLPTTIYDGPICGNGFKEDGEECDCGLPKDCTNRCCNPSTCRLYPLAQCGTGRCCNLDECKLKPASTLCREPRSECDLAEFCNGTSEFCPEDVYLQNGVQCKKGESYCYNGQCNTHTDQCKLLWGDTGRMSDPICFQQLNTNGNNDGNCGYNWTTDRYKRCDKENVMCGLLHCVHLNEKLMFWRDNLAIDTRASFLSRGNDQHVCRSAMLDVGLDMPDPGFVPDGAKCEENKICINHECIPLAKLKVEFCPNNCHGRGRCNSKGHCHCNHGYAPPLCDRPGYGGSVDSGPASNEYATTEEWDLTTPNSPVPTNATTTMTDSEPKKDLLIALLVVFLLIIPLIVLAVIAFLNRRRLAQWWKLMPGFKYRVRSKSGKPKPPPQPPQPNPSAGQGRKDFSPPSRQPGLISNPLLHHSTHTSDVHPKPKIWDAGRSSVNHPAPSAPPPPARPAAPRRPPSLAKSNSSVETKSSSKKVRLSIPIQETGGPPSPGSKPKVPDQCVTSMTGKQDSNKNIPQSPKSNPIVKRESFRGSEISDPVLVCTTNRNSLVLADGKVDIIGPEARMSRSPPLSRPNAITVKRSQSERPVSRPDPPHPTSNTQPPGGGTLKKSASTRSPTRVASPPLNAANTSASVTNTNQSGFRSRPVPPLPTYEEDDTQPIYTNESSDMSDLLSAIDGVLKDSSNLYTNLSGTDIIHSPIQETNPPAPPRPTSAKPGGASSRQTSSVIKPATTSALTLNKTKEELKVKPINRIMEQQTPASKYNPTSQPSNIIADKKNTNTTDKSLKSESFRSDDKKSVPTKSDLVSANSLRLKGAVSDELKNKIMSRSDSPGKLTQGDNSPLQKARNPTNTNTSLNTTSGAKPPANKASSNDVHKAGSKVGPGSSQSASKPLARVSSPTPKVSQTDTSGGPSRPTRSSTQKKDNPPSNKVISSGDSKKTNPTTGGSTTSAGSTRSNPGSTAKDKASVKASPAVNSTVSSLAAKFGQSSDTSKPSLHKAASMSAADTHKPSLNKTSSISTAEGSKRPVAGKVSETDKPALPGKPKLNSAKASTLDRPVSRVKSMTGDTKPSLPPKPGDQGATPAPSSSNAQPKRVQSYRI